MTETEEKQNKLVYFNRVEIVTDNYELLERRDDDELFDLRREFEKPKKEVKK